jgi:ketosteroid isomerase-like protein
MPVGGPAILAAMPESNADIVHRLYAAWQRDGFGVVPELMAPDIEYVNPPYAVEPGVRHGHDGFAEAAGALLAIYGEYTVTAAELREAGDRVAVTARVATSSRGNAIPIEAERGYLFDVRDGKVTRFAWFNDPREALAELEPSTPAAGS